jgi:hypothetical protein
MVAVCAVVTVDAAAVNPALVVAACTETFAGTATAASLLDRLTIAPPLGAAADNVTVHAVDAAPVSEELAHEIALSDGGTGGFSCKVRFFDPVVVAAMSFTDLALLTDAMTALKAALDVSLATMIEAGTTTAPSLLERRTSIEFSATPSIVTTQLSVPAPVIVVFAQLMLYGINPVCPRINST